MRFKLKLTESGCTKKKKIRIGGKSAQHKKCKGEKAGVPFIRKSWSGEFRATRSTLERRKKLSREGKGYQEGEARMGNVSGSLKREGRF